MRKILIAVLLAGAATPAFAAAETGADRRDSARSERAERVPARAQRAQQRAQRSEARQERSEPRRQAGQEAPARAERQQARTRNSAPNVDQRRALVQREQQRAAAVRVRGEATPRASVQQTQRARVQQPAPARAQQQAARQGDTVRNWRSAERQRADSPSAIQDRNLRRASGSVRSGGLVEQRRPAPRVIDRDPTRVSSRRPAPGIRAPEPETARLAHARPRHEWRSDWRRDRRYNWSDYRQRNRSSFHIGIYVDPFGWGYNRYNVGWRLWPSHYSSSYWLNDPWSYRLPPAYGPYRWVRYWDDALLVNIYTGQVVDAVHNFFW